MKKLLIVLAVVFVAGIVFLAFGPFYILDEGNQAVVNRLGKIVATATEAGVHFKFPGTDSVITYPKKVMAWDGDPQLIPTQEQQFIWVDTTARWRISDPVKFYSTVNILDTAYSRLDGVIDSAVRTVISMNPMREAVRNSNIINEIVRTTTTTTDDEGTNALGDLALSATTYDVIAKGRQKLAEEMLATARLTTSDFGIELIDIVIRQIKYSDDLTESVYNRMIKERNQISQAYRSYGEGKKKSWLGSLENEQKTIQSKAYEESETIRGRADAEAAAIYSQAYSIDPDFYQFWRSIESYRSTFAKFNKTLTTDMDYFRYLYSSSGKK